MKPSIPKGTRDFSPIEMTRRNYIFDTLKDVFQLHGYQAIETPSMENLSTLLGKYGEEGDKLLFKVLNSGDFLKKVKEDIHGIDPNKVATQISEKGLRYDLTVPFARYVVQHRNEISFPFKRYQIQPVWRADRPQKGRYREFFQCDVDVIGSNSLLNEVELVVIIDEVFKRLNINTEVLINNRKILAGIAEVIGQPEKIIDITVAIDKLDKIGIEKVNQELLDKGIPAVAVDQLQPIILLNGSIDEKFAKLETILAASEVGLKGIEEAKEIFDHLKEMDLTTKWDLDLTLARGLNYYTGAIIEVKSADVKIGSICGGGRYDDLTGIFGLADVSGVGISFGADRIYDVLNELGKFPADAEFTTKLMFVNFGAKEASYCLGLLKDIRKAGINAELFPDSAKMKKQMTYANNKNIEFVALIGENEMNEGTITLKNMQSGEQKTVNLEQLIQELA
ncbi:MAG: histidine--tRNA ligase [Bacteroidetes bacterium]|nr:histidine--tRNA ligase [Bacteroidota bacterium]